MNTPYARIMFFMMLSLVIYVFYRTDSTVVNQLILNFSDPSDFLELKSRVRQDFPIPPLVIYSLPEGLWVYCATLLSRPYRFQVGNLILSCAYTPLVYAVLLELLQLGGLVNGYFDFWDVVFTTGFWLAARIRFKAYHSENIFGRINRGRIGFCLIYLVVYLSHVI